MAIEVKVPDIGDFKDVPVIEIHVKPGDTIKADDPLVTLESDKATMDVPADRDGTVEAVLVKVGDKVGEGVAVVTLKGSAADAPVTPPPSVIAQQEPAPAPKPTPAPAAAARRCGGGRGRCGHGPCQPERAPARPRARGRPGQGQGHRRKGPDHQGRRERLPARAGWPRLPPQLPHPAAAWASPRSPPRTSPSSARSRASRLPASSA